jgi:16S rRNA (cytidine1402-2'-O)-methyltransferase
MPGRLHVVATPIGNLEDITLRALRVLREADLIAAEDTRRTARLLQHYSIVTPTTSLHEHNERRKLGMLLSRLAGGARIALVSDAGTPTVSDPGSHLIAAALEQEIPVEPVPGPSAVIAALGVSGFAADSFVFLGFPPSRSQDRKQWAERLSLEARSSVFFEAPHRIGATLTELALFLGERQILVARELTKLHEELVKGPITTVVESLSKARGEYTVVVQGRPSDRPASRCAPTDDHLWHEFGYMTETSGLTRRQAISALSKSHGISAREVYSALERAKSHLV